MQRMLPTIKQSVNSNQVPSQPHITKHKSNVSDGAENAENRQISASGRQTEPSVPQQQIPSVLVTLFLKSHTHLRDRWLWTQLLGSEKDSENSNLKVVSNAHMKVKTIP